MSHDLLWPAILVFGIDFASNVFHFIVTRRERAFNTKQRRDWEELREKALALTENIERQQMRQIGIEARRAVVTALETYVRLASASSASGEAAKS